MRRRFLVLVTCLSVVAMARPLVGQANQQPPVRFELDTDATRLAPGTSASATLRAYVAPGWHLYALAQPDGGPQPTRITLPAGQPFSLRTPLSPPAPRRKMDANFALETSYYDRDVAFDLPLRVAGTTTDGAASLVVEVRYQACTDSICLRPRTVRLTREVTIARD